MIQHRYIKLVTIEERRNYLVSEPIYLTTNFFPEILVATEMKKTSQILMNKPVYLGLSILERSETVMHDSWYNYIKLKYG